MPAVHVLKNTESEVVLKCYKESANGGTIQIELDGEYIKRDNETYIQNQSLVTIKELFWGVRSGKVLDVTRVDNKAANTVHGHYHLNDTGSYNFIGFVDDAYANGAIRIVGNGAYHVLLKLGKSGYETQ
jgi:hypothetical protein